MRGFEQAADPDRPYDPLATFFKSTLYKRRAESEPTLMEGAQERWHITAPIAAQYSKLREDLGPGEREKLWLGFVEDVREAGIDPNGWSSPDI